MNPFRDPRAGATRLRNTLLAQRRIDAVRLPAEFRSIHASRSARAAASIAATTIASFGIGSQLQSSFGTPALYVLITIVLLATCGGAILAYIVGDLVSSVRFGRHLSRWLERTDDPDADLERLRRPIHEVALEIACRSDCSAVAMPVLALTACILVPVLLVGASGSPIEIGTPVALVILYGLLVRWAFYIRQLERIDLERALKCSKQLAADSNFS